MSDNPSSVAESRARLTRELAESERRLREITASAMDAIIMMDGQGRISFWNPCAERVFGYTAPEALGRDLHSFLAPARFHEDYARGFAHFHGTGQGPVVGRIQELSAVRKDGSEFPIELSVGAVRLQEQWHAVGVLRDISDRVQAEESLRLFRTLLDHSNDGVYVIAAHGGRFKDVNAQACTSLGYDRHELLGMHVYDIETFIPDAEAFRAHVRELRSSGAERIEGAHRRRDGTLIPVEISASYVTLEGQDFILATVRDITERQRAEREIQQLNETLEERVRLRTGELHQTNRRLEQAMEQLKSAQAAMVQTEKLAALGTLTAGLTHEMNNPLMGIVNYLEYAAERAEDPKSRKVLDKAGREIQRIRDILANMLSFARPADRAVQSTDVEQAMDNTLDLLRADSASRGLDLEKRLEPDLPRVRASRDGLQQVLLNLLMNARDAMQGSPARRLRVGARAVDQGVQIRIEDSGAGVPAHLCERIFDPFFTTKPPGRGTGLGLSVSRGIIEGFGGDLSCAESDLGGTSFRVTLKIAGADKEAEIGSDGRTSSGD